MSKPTKVVLLACGSYNPVTIMHLRMFELAKDSLDRTGRFCVVGGIISPVSDDYKKKDLVSAKHRCAMLKNALKSSSWIRLDTWECDQPKWSTTLTVIKHFQSVLQNSSHNTHTSTSPAPSKKRRKEQINESINDDDSLGPIQLNNKDKWTIKLLCGGDLLESFGTPGLWAEEDIETIVSHGLVCVTRAGSNPRKFIYESDVLTKYEDNIMVISDWMHNDISATKIRRALRRNESVKYLLQDSVIDYIRDNGLYGYTRDNTTCPGVPSPGLLRTRVKPPSHSHK